MHDGADAFKRVWPPPYHIDDASRDGFECRVRTVSALFAVFGSVEAARDFGAMAVDSDLRPRALSEWLSEEGDVRLGSQGSPVAVAEETRTAVAVSGWLEGGSDLAAAALGAYRRAGEVGLTALRGEYAFALWDGIAGHLLVGCDAMGLHAPAYVSTGRGFLLASSAMALLSHPHVPKTWDDVYLFHALSGLGSRSPSATPFGAIRRLVGGELLRISIRGIERLRGDHLKFRRRRFSDRADAVGELGATLDRAVRMRAAIGGRGVALSGGVDSFVVAAALAQVEPRFEALSLYAPKGVSSRDPAALAAAALPEARHHRVALIDVPVVSLEGVAPPDDPMLAGPAMQPSRIALLRAAHEMGLHQVFDGEGGDELFDLPWWPVDFVREQALPGIVSALTMRHSARRLIRDVIVSASLWPASTILLDRTKRRLGRSRPWLNESFWRSQSFAAAWDELLAYGRLRRASDRIGLILGVHGRYRRAQEQVRRQYGIAGASPLVDRNVVELVAPMPAGVGMHPHHDKVLLRCLAERRGPPEIAWTPKQEPLHDWLVQRCLALQANVDRAVMNIRTSPRLKALVDPQEVVNAAALARRQQANTSLAYALVQLFAFAEWFATVERRYGF